MATDKRQRQRERRQEARARVRVVETRTWAKSVALRVSILGVVIIVAAVLLWLALRDDGGSDDLAAEGPDTADLTFPDVPTPPSPGGSLTGETPCPAEDGSAARTTTFESAPPVCIDPDLEYTAVIDTTFGPIRVDLDPAGAPNAVNSFVVLARYHYYDGSAIFFTDPGGGVIRGGSPFTNTEADPGPGFSTEPDGDGNKYLTGQLVWASSPSQGDAGGQFLITVNAAASELDNFGDLPILGSLDFESQNVALAIADTHVDNPDTAIGGRPASDAIVSTITIESREAGVQPTIDPTRCPAPDGSSPRLVDFDGPQPQCIDPTKRYVAVFDTTAGEIRIDLDTENTPSTVNNFVVLARYHYYDNTVLFRTDPSIGIIQGGAPHTNSPADPGPGYTIPDEGSGFTYVPGQLVMARTAAPNSASAQFFLTVTEEAARLNDQGTYVVFGRVDPATLAVPEAIIASHVDDPNSSLGGGPDPQVVVNSVTIEEIG